MILDRLAESWFVAVYGKFSKNCLLMILQCLLVDNIVPNLLTTLAPLQVLSLLTSLHYLIYIFEWFHRLYKPIIVGLDILEFLGTTVVA